MSVTPPSTSTCLWYLENVFRFSSQPIAEAPSTIGMARPIENASNRTAPNSGDAEAAAAPISTTSSGLHTGHTETEHTAPSATAPTKEFGRLALNDDEGKGTRTNPAQINPSTMSTGLSRSPH